MYTILIIDDEPVIREGISENIDWQKHGFRLVGACSDGREGIRAVEELHPDVVLTDICMPFVDGLDLAAFIADRCPQTKTILLTGYDEFEYAQEAVKLKVSDFLLKPITADELRTILDRLRAELDLELQRRQDLQRLHEQLHESLPLLRERFLNRLIQGDANEVERRLSLLELSLPGPYFNVLLVDPDRIDTEDDLAALVIQNTIDEITGETTSERETAGACVFRTPEEQTVVLYSAADESTAAVRPLECAEAISERVKRANGITVSIGIGSPVDNLARLDEAYRDARVALGQRLVLGPNQISTFEQMRGISNEPVPRVEEHARTRVVRELKSGTTEQTEAAIADFMALYRTAGRTAEECSTGMHRLLADMLNAFEFLGVYPPDIPETLGDPFARLVTLKTIEAVEQWLYGLHRNVRSVLADRNQQHSVAKALEAEEYIAAHYAERGLSLGCICQALSVSKSYFSPLFKAHTGMTFVEYLTNFRMERAKELLCASNMKGYQVAEKIGFTDAHYFSLTFRKQTGMSPTEYRESVQGPVG